MNVPPQQQPFQFQSASLYVGDLLPDITEGTLYEQFQKVGPVASIRVCKDSVTRQSLGYAYVNFIHSQDAERALDTMNFTEIKGRPCRIMWSQRDPSIRKSGVGNIFVKGLTPAVDNKSLYDTFSVFGNILSCKVVTEKDGKSKGYGYVHYETAEAAQEAIAKFTGNFIDDNQVTVSPFIPKTDRKIEWTNVYIGNIPKNWDDKQLENIMVQFGPIQNCVIMKDADGNSKGYGFSNFKDHESAVRCTQGLSSILMDGNSPNATKHIPRNEMRALSTRNSQGRNLYVKNLEASITDADLREDFKQFGEIHSARVMRDGPNFQGPSKGFGFVCFKTAEQAQAALQGMNHRNVRGKVLYVGVHQNGPDRRVMLHNQWMMRSANAYNPQFMPPAMPFMPVYPPNMYRGYYPPQPRMPPRYPGNPRGPPSPPGYFGYPMPNMVQPMTAQPQQHMKAGFQGHQQRNVRNPHVARNPPRTNQPRPTPAAMPVQQVQAPVVAPTPVPAPGPVGSVSYAQTLASLEPHDQKNALGESLYPMIYGKRPHLAGKITGMLLEMDNAELINLLESPDALNQKIEEAVAVLNKHGIV